MAVRLQTIYVTYEQPAYQRAHLVARLRSLTMQERSLFKIYVWDFKGRPLHAVTLTVRNLANLNEIAYTEKATSGSFFSVVDTYPGIRVTAKCGTTYLVQDFDFSGGIPPKLDLVFDPPLLK